MSVKIAIAHETELNDLILEGMTFDCPEWVDWASLTLGDLESIMYGGCESGAYMPAVTYHEARETMSIHGDAVLEYIEDALGELPAIEKGMSWSGMACFYLSYAVQLWADSTANQICEEHPEARTEVFSRVI